jgi:ketosteroid isomerase-like protein
MRSLLTRLTGGRRYAAALAATTVVAIAALATASNAAAGGTGESRASGAAVAALDTEFQAATKHNDAATIDRIVADDFVIVTGRGTTFTKADLLHDARTQACTYEEQDEVAHTQTVRVYGHATAEVTALLWIKGSCQDGSVIDVKLWFSDTYVRVDGRWRYVFGQSSRPL